MARTMIAVPLETLLCFTVSTTLASSMTKSALPPPTSTLATEMSGFFSFTSLLVSLEVLLVATALVSPLLDTRWAVSPTCCCWSESWLFVFVLSGETSWLGLEGLTSDLPPGAAPGGADCCCCLLGAGLAGCSLVTSLIVPDAASCKHFFGQKIITFCQWKCWRIEDRHAYVVCGHNGVCTRVCSTPCTCICPPPHSKNIHIVQTDQGKCHISRVRCVWISGKDAPHPNPEDKNSIIFTSPEKCGYGAWVPHCLVSIRSSIDLPRSGFSLATFLLSSPSRGGEFPGVASASVKKKYAWSGLTLSTWCRCLRRMAKLLFLADFTLQLQRTELFLLLVGVFLLFWKSEISEDRVFPNNKENRHSVCPYDRMSVLWCNFMFFGVTSLFFLNWKRDSATIRDQSFCCRVKEKWQVWSGVKKPTQLQKQTYMKRKQRELTRTCGLSPSASLQSNSAAFERRCADFTCWATKTKWKWQSREWKKAHTGTFWFHSTSTGTSTKPVLKSKTIERRKLRITVHIRVNGKQRSRTNSKVELISTTTATVSAQEQVKPCKQIVKVKQCLIIMNVYKSNWPENISLAQ